MQTALNIDVPNSGVLLGGMLFATGTTIKQDRFIQPRFEATLGSLIEADFGAYGTVSCHFA